MTKARMTRIAFLAPTFAGALLAAGCDGPAAPSDPVVPLLISPAPNAVLDNGCRTDFDAFQWDFAWAEVRAASHYHLQVIGRDTALFTIDDDQLVSPSYTSRSTGYVLDKYRLGWRWRVRAQKGDVWGEFSPYRTFDVEPLDTDCAR